MIWVFGIGTKHNSFFIEEGFRVKRTVCVKFPYKNTRLGWVVTFSYQLHDLPLTRYKEEKEEILNMHLTRSLKVKLYPNFHKLEAIRYTCNRYQYYLQSCVNYLYYREWLHHGSTADLGNLVNQAQKEAIGLLNAGREASKATNQKFNLPTITKTYCPATIRKSEDSIFDYWIRIADPFGTRNGVIVPTKSYGSIKNKLKTGWELSQFCKIYQNKAGKWFAYIYLTKEVAKPTELPNKLGVDVGWNHGVARSDNYLM